MEMYLDEILAMPGCERLREWCAIGPVQRAAFEDAATLLAAQTMTREREQMRSLVERHQAEAQSYREAYHQLLEQMAAAKARETIPAAIFMLPTDATLEQVAAAWDGPSSIAPKPLKR